MATLDTEKERSRTEIANYLREFADELDPRSDMSDRGIEDDRSMTVIVDNESATVTPPDTMFFRVTVDTDSSLLSAGMDRGVTFSLEWNADEVDAPDELDIE